MQLFPAKSTTISPDGSVRLQDGRRNWREYEWYVLAPMLAVHVAPIVGLLFWGWSADVGLVMAVTYAVNMFAITAGYHRYFAHRAYKTSRVFQFVLAWFAEGSAQEGVLTWAARHRHHHKYSDKELDAHSPRQHGFLYAHLLWIINHNEDLNVNGIRDMRRFAELRWIDRFYLAPVLLNGLFGYLYAGVPGVVIGTCGAIVFSWHLTFAINSLAHVWGTRRFDTSDDSRNNFLLALLTFGEGWHNNHHHCMNSARQGFRWWEIDLTYMGLWLLARIGVVWDLRPVREALPTHLEVAPIAS